MLPKSWKTKRPMGLLVSNGSVAERMVTPAASSSA
jgi:hypothetical protein